MRVIFAGTPKFAAPALEAILNAGHDVALVLTQPDRPARRGLALTQSPVKQCALAHGLQVEQPHTLKSPDAERLLRDQRADILVVVAYGLILPQTALDSTRLGAINIHASLLPRWRGAAPIQRAVASGDTETGITIMQLELGLDTGPILLARRMPILERDTAGTLHDRLMILGAQMVVEALDLIATGQAKPAPQPSAGVTYAAKINKAEAVLDWTRPAAELARRVRAFDPVPGMATRIQGHEVKIWCAEALEGEGAAPGVVVRIDPNGPVVACNPGLLRLEVMQRAGGKRLSSADVLRGMPIAPHDRFELA
jgi:methionyl-tRNA formyltransferase